MARRVSRITYGPKIYFPILGEEGGPQRVHLGYYRFTQWDVTEWTLSRFGGLYFAVRIGRRWFRLSWVRNAAARH